MRRFKAGDRVIRTGPTQLEEAGGRKITQGGTYTVKGLGASDVIAEGYIMLEGFYRRYAANRFELVKEEPKSHMPEWF